MIVAALLPALLQLALWAAEGSGYEQPFRAGLIALQGNRLSNAERNLQTAADLAPRNGRVWVALAQTYWKLKEQAKADDAAGKAAKFAPDDPAVLQSLAIYYSESNQTLKAADAQARYAALGERAVALYFEAAQPLLQKEKFADAITILQQAKTKLGENAQIELALGVAYYGLRRFDDAAGAFLAVITLDPVVEQPYLFLGRMLDQIPERLPTVTARFVQYQAANPASWIGYLLHAKALNARSAEPETARKLLEKSISINGADASAHFELASLLERMKLLPEAAREFESAASLEPSDPATHYRLSRVYERLGNAQAAAAERARHARLVTSQDSAR